MEAKIDGPFLLKLVAPTRVSAYVSPLVVKCSLSPSSINQSFAVLTNEKISNLIKLRNQIGNTLFNIENVKIRVYNS